MPITVTFKAKPKVLHYAGRENPEYSYIDIPKLTRAHVDMHEARIDKVWGGLANSDLFENMLNGATKKKFSNMRIKLNAIPEGVSVDTTKFLHVCSFTLDGWR